MKIERKAFSGRSPRVPLLFFSFLRWLDEGLRLICLHVSTSATFSTANSNSITAKSIVVNTGNPTQLRTQTFSQNRSIKGTEL